MSDWTEHRIWGDRANRRVHKGAAARPPGMRIRYWCVVAALAGWAPAMPAAAEGVTGGVFAPVEAAKSKLSEAGLKLDLSLTQFYQGLTSGGGDHAFEYGGKFDAVANLIGERLGLWDDFFVTAHFEQVFGDDVNTQGDGTILPLNTALAFPRLGGRDWDLSVIATQRFGSDVSLSLGKFNMLDAAAKTPLIGGGGIDTFQHIGLAAPISGVTPPYLAGGLLGVNVNPVNLSLLVYDPRSAQDFEVLETLFSDGVTVSLSATFPITILGRKGFHSLRGVYSSQDGIDLESLPQLELPREASLVLERTRGYYYGSYSFQQYLVEDPNDPTKGWGVFGQISLSEGNPNPISNVVIAGVGGSGFLPGRSDDRWGLAYFRYFLSSDLKRGLAALGTDLRDEWGGEAFYNFAVSEHFRLSANMQVIRPGNSETETAVFAGLGAQLKF